MLSRLKWQQKHAMSFTLKLAEDRVAEFHSSLTKCCDAINTLPVRSRKDILFLKVIMVHFYLMYMGVLPAHMYV